MSAPLTAEQIRRADAYSRALAEAGAPLTRIYAELKHLTPVERFDLLGELLEPSLHGPFQGAAWCQEEDDLYDALMPVIAAYRRAYDAANSAANGEWAA